MKKRVRRNRENTAKLFAAVDKMVPHEDVDTFHSVFNAFAETYEAELNVGKCCSKAYAEAFYRLKREGFDPYQIGYSIAVKPINKLM